MNFAQRLNKRIESLDSCLVIGIDPDVQRLFGENSPFVQAFKTTDVEGVLDGFCDLLLQVAKTHACAVKPQSAFFESMGLSGLRSLSRCLKSTRELNIPAILDVKRGDIGSTAKAYSKAYLDIESDFSADAITISPYLGPDTLLPFIEDCKKWGKGLFVLVKTSNPQSGVFQDAVMESGRHLFEEVARNVELLGRDLVGEDGYTSIGAVVGATYPKHLTDVRNLMPNSLFLVPGYGAQGGKADDLRAAFNPDGKGAVVSSSRGIDYAYEGEKGKIATREDIAKAMELAAQKAKNDIRRAAAKPSI